MPQDRSELEAMLGIARGSDTATISMRGNPSAAEMPDGRYELGELIASGGQGDIYRIYDRRLRRQLVMKMLDKDLASDSMSIARFIQEAQLTAQLQHPAIVPVHEIGALLDGRPFYTMTEVRGRTLAVIIDEVHAASKHGWHAEAGGIGFGRLVDVFQRVCDAVGYAHACGIIHRDLKPQNVMIGAFGEVLVLDWGLARFVGAPEEVRADLSTIRQDNGSFASEIGTIVGTRGYMPPEQAGGNALSLRSDVFALGVILREILTGERGVTTPMRIAPQRPVAAELVAIVERAIAPAPEDRYPDAKDLAQAIASFIDGDRKRERAAALFGEAQALVPKVAALREEAAAVQREARAALDPVPPQADASQKQPGWELEDHARELAQQADLETFQMTRLVDSALIEADLPEAHALLANHYRELHEVAERAGDPATARLEVLLRAHDRGEHAPYLAGVGALSLASDPPAEVEIRRYVERGRRLVDEPVMTVRTPIDALELPRGSYLLILRAPGHHDVRYPVAIGRHAHWRPIRPGAATPSPVVLPALGTIGDDELYVPGGPFLCGGDPQAAGEVLPRQTIWVDSFVIRRDPISNRELVAMANELVDAARAGDTRAEELAFSVVPRHRGTTSHESGAAVWARDAAGHFVLGSDDEGISWAPNTPAFMVNWHGAVAYATWLAARTGRPYRLPGELEFEKAARGVDGRAFPWGDFFDPSYACMRMSLETVRPVAIGEFPVDESPYGVRGLAGNVVEWTLDEYHREGPRIVRGLYTPPTDVTAAAQVTDRTLRGGCFLFDSFLLRAASRHNSSSVVRDVTLGFRLVRSL